MQKEVNYPIDLLVSSSSYLTELLNSLHTQLQRNVLEICLLLYKRKQCWIVKGEKKVFERWECELWSWAVFDKVMTPMAASFSNLCDYRPHHLSIIFTRLSIILHIIKPSQTSNICRKVIFIHTLHQNLQNQHYYRRTTCYHNKITSRISLLQKL